MGVLVDHDTGFKAAVALGGGVVPDVHPHAAWLAIWRRSKVCVVRTRSILSVKDYHVIA